MSKVFLAAVTFLAITGCIAGRQRCSSGELSIMDARTMQQETTEEYKKDMAAHKDHDVIARRKMTDDDQVYEVTFYISSNDTLFRHSVSFEREDDLDKAVYKWINDTMLSARIYNTVTGNGLSFKAWGNRRHGEKITGSATGE